MTDLPDRPWEHPRRAWASLTTVEVETLVAEDPVIVLPLAAVEQHGPHLPLSTDLDIGAGILGEALRRLRDDLPLRVLPPLVFGASDEHRGSPGTLSLPAARAIGVVEDLGDGLADAGVRRLVLSNSHGGNRAAMDIAALALRRRHGMLVVKATYPRFPRPDDLSFPESEWRHGLHGGALETSMMLHLRPEAVRSGAMEAWARDPSPGGLGEELEDEMEHLGPEGPASFAWTAGDLHPTGVAGDPRLASREAGERLVRHYGAYLAGVIRDARAFPLERLG